MQGWATSERLRKAFVEPELQVLGWLRSEIDCYEENTRDFLLVAFLSILPEFSRAVADGGWFRWTERPDQSQHIPDRLLTRVGDMIADLQMLLPGNLARVTECKAEVLDARLVDTLGIDSFDGLITSPPYANRHDYSRVFQIELLTMGTGEREIFAMRHESLRSHVEARPPTEQLAERCIGYQSPTILKEHLDLLPETADPRIRPMIEGYFQDLWLVLCAARKALRAGAPAALVVGNVRHAGVLFPVDEILVALGEQAGYDHVESWVIRLRGNSAQQMKMYGRQPSRETVVMLRA